MEEQFTEDTKVEQPAIEQLKLLGWSYIHGSELTPELGERKSFRDVVLERRLSIAIKKINPWINDENLHKTIRDLTILTQTSLIEANHFLYKKLNAHISIEQDLGKGRKSQTVKVIDFENIDNNEFLVVNQFKISGTNDNIRPDIILFVNGLPLAVIEAKSPYITNPMEEAINQLRRYANLRNPIEQEGSERLFWYNQIMVATCRDKARAGTISSPMAYYLSWHKFHENPEKVFGHKPTHQEILIDTLFDKQRFLDIIQNFVLFDKDEGKIIKKIPRYQQYRAVNKALERLKKGSSRKDRGGVIWHTQGSGKSLTMAFLATKIRRDPSLKDYKMVFITDRTDLHRQLTDNFKEVLDETVIEAKNVAHFKELLAQDSSDLITGMLQKFQERELDVFEELNPSEKIVVLIDEAHRGHYKTFGANINTALPNAPKIALTGTPLMKNDKTQKEFGSYIDQYTIEQAVQDGATVQIIYEGRESQTKVTGDSLDKLFETYFKEYTQEERDQIIRKHGKEIAVLEAPKRIEMIAADILDHYRNKIEPEGFKAQIVAASRRAAILYKEAIERLNGPECAVIISGNHNDDEFYKRHTEKTGQETAISRFKRPMDEDKLSILIVKDMLLTGFDAPIEQVMYLDRKLKEHTLLQAIARVNRTRKGKEYGFIVDYYGLSDYLKEALEIFSAKDVEGALQPLKDEIPKLEARHTKVMAHFPNGITDIDECIDSLRDEEKRATFEIDFKRFLASMNAVLPDKGATPFIPDMRKLGKINHGAKNRYRDEQLNIADAGAKVKKLIDEHIYSTGVDPRIPPTPLFDTKFMEEVRAQKTPKTQALELEYAIKNHIKNNSDQNPEYYKDLSKKLAEILRTKNEKWDELVGLLLNFRENMEQERQEEAEHYGFTDTEHAFFRILKAEVAEKYPDRTEDKKLEAELVTFTTKIVNTLEEVMKIVDFPKKPPEIKEARKKIRHMLDDTSFCDVTEDKKMITTITNRFMDLAGVKFKND